MSSERTRRPVGRRPATEGRKTFAVCLGGAVLLCAFGLTLTWARLAVVERAYQLGRARTQNEQLHREVAKLSLEVEALQNAAKVEGAAHGLGLMKADRVLVVKPAAVASEPMKSDGVLASN